MIGITSKSDRIDNFQKTINWDNRYDLYVDSPPKNLINYVDSLNIFLKVSNKLK